MYLDRTEAAGLTQPTATATDAQRARYARRVWAAETIGATPTPETATTPLPFHGPFLEFPDEPTDERIPSELCAYWFLMRHGDGEAPGNRYGTTVSECAEVAIAVHRAMVAAGGERENTYQALDADMFDVLSDCLDVGAVLAEVGR